MYIYTCVYVYMYTCVCVSRTDVHLVFTPSRGTNLVVANSGRSSRAMW